MSRSLRLEHTCHGGCDGQGQSLQEDLAAPYEVVDAVPVCSSPGSAVKWQPGLVCPSCRCCLAVKLLQHHQYIQLDHLLDSCQPHLNGWVRCAEPWHFIIHTVLNFVIYRLNESPDKSGFECDYAMPDLAIDTVFLLWCQGRATGFATIRHRSQLAGLFHCGTINADQDMIILDTIFVRKSHRGQGHATQLIQWLLTSQAQYLIGLSSPISTSMLKLLLRWLARHHHARNKIWEVFGQDLAQQQNIWWAAVKYSRERGFALNEVIGVEATKPTAVTTSTAPT